MKLKTLLLFAIIGFSGCEKLGLKDEKWELYVTNVARDDYFEIENKSQAMNVNFALEGELTHDARILWSDRAPDEDTLFKDPQEILVPRGTVNKVDINHDYYGKKLYIKYVSLNDSTSGFLKIKVKI